MEPSTMVTVHLDQLYSYSHDPEAVAKQLAVMQKKGLRLNIHVKDPHTAEVFKHLPAAKKMRRRRLIKPSPRVILAIFSLGLYGVVGWSLFA